MFNTEFQIVLLSAVFICCHAAVICISLVSETDSVFSASQYVTSYILSVRFKYKCSAEEDATENAQFE